MEDPLKTMKGPDFIGIGSAKAGTSWLSRNLEKHPQVYIPFKELHYFDEKEVNPRLSLLSRMFGDSDWRLKRWRRMVKRYVLIPVFTLSATQKTRLFIKYYFNCNNDRKYLKFLSHPQKVSGEITPAYSILKRETIKEVYQLAPACKIVFLIRNPIERVWSQMVMNLCKQEKIPYETLTDQMIRQYLENPTERDDYLKIIENWTAYFPREQFFIGFFDDIKNNPGKFYLEVCEFLGIEADEKMIPGDIRTAVGKGIGIKIPEKYIRLLARVHFQQIKAVSQAIGGYAEEWLAYAQKYA